MAIEVHNLIRCLAVSFTIWCPSLLAQCPNDSGFFVLRVDNGLTNCGTMSITLNSEGLVYRWLDSAWVKQAHFVAFDSLPSRSVCILQEVMADRDFIDLLEQLETCELESGKFTFKPRLRIELVITEAQFCRRFRAGCGNHAVDELLDLLKSLIPVDHRDEFKSLSYP